MSVSSTFFLGNNCRIRIPYQVGKYTIQNTIGEGGFAVVALAEDPQKNKVAIKIVSREAIQRFNIMAYIENELRLCARFNHPNIVKVYDIIYEEDIILIVMEYLQMGDLQSIIASGIHFSYEDQIRITKEILSALDYLHTRGISHRDIKLENILFDKELHPKLIDFGLSKEGSTELYTYCGTPYYMAPEVIKGGSYDGRVADIWSFGVVLHVLSTGTYPWDRNLNDAKLIKMMTAETLEIIIEPKGIIGEVIKRCLNYNPKERPTSSELLELIEFGYKGKNITSKIEFNKKNQGNSFLPKLSITKSSPMLSMNKDPSLRKMKFNIRPNIAGQFNIRK